jgi:hypothetical protein
MRKRPILSGQKPLLGVVHAPDPSHRALGCRGETKGKTTDHGLQDHGPGAGILQKETKNAKAGEKVELHGCKAASLHRGLGGPFSLNRVYGLTLLPSPAAGEKPGGVEAASEAPALNIRASCAVTCRAGGWRVWTAGESGPPQAGCPGRGREACCSASFQSGSVSGCSCSGRFGQAGAQPGTSLRV